MRWRLSVGLGLALASLSYSSAESGSSKPNVLLVSIDTLRYDYLGCYGNRVVKTPHLDALAARGVLFENAVAHAVVTLPSHASILTGLYPTGHGIHDNAGYSLQEQHRTLAEIFSENGYKTGAFVAAFPLDSRFGLTQGFDLYDDRYPSRRIVNEMAMPERRGDAVVGGASAWLEAQGEAPWFLFVHLYDPHFPYEPPEEHRRLYPSDAYAGEVSFVDEQVGLLLASLEVRGLLDRTIVLLTADHGEGLGEQGERTHGIFAYEATIRVPLLLAAPSISQRGQRAETRVRHVDIAPTLIDLAGLDETTTFDGESLSRFWKEASTASTESYFESLSTHLNRDWAPLRGLYSGDLKYIRLPIPELYDISRDLLEKENLCVQDDPRCRTLDEKLERMLAGPRSGTSRQALDSETAAQLRSLGYLAASGSESRRTYGVEDDPKNLLAVDHLLNDAMGAYRRGKARTAEDMLRRAIAQQPRLGLAYLHLSYVYGESGDRGQAILVLEEGLAKGVRDSEVLAKLGLYLQEAGRVQESIERLGQALQLDPRDVDAYNYLGMAYARDGDLARAEAAFAKAIDLDPSAAMVYHNRGTLHLSRKAHARAVADFEKALQYDPELAGAENGLGVAYASTGRPEVAVQHWKKAVELNPSHYDALLNLGHLLARLERPEEARVYLEKFANTAPEEPYRRDLERVRVLLRGIR
ncbi:MAG: sulfatase-like hydrolase/transferase [Vicinamibacteria bacterium]